MKRIKNIPAQGRDYAKMLKDYFGFHLSGMEMREEGGQMQAQVIYNDFKHIDTVRRELAQLMPEVEFTKLRRDYTDSACMWALNRIMWEEPMPKEHTPVVYVKREENLIRTTIRDIAIAELRQLELDDDDDIPYTDAELKVPDDEMLKQNSWD